MSQPFSFNANQVSYATGIAAALGQIHLHDPAWALSSDDIVYEKMLRDPVIAGALDHLNRLIVGHEWSFEPAEDEKPDRALAKILESLTKQQRGFSQSLYNLAFASFKGATWGLIVPERKVLKLGDGKPREWTVVSRVRDSDKRRFRLTQVHAMSQGPLSRGPLADAVKNLQGPAVDAGALGSFRWEFNRGWAAAALNHQSSSWWQPLDAVAPFDRWIQHVPDTSERGLGYGYGLADDIYAYFWMKQQVLKFGLQGLERWGQGFLYAKTKALRDGFAKGAAQSAALQQTVNVLRKFRSENVAAVDQDTELALLDMPATAAVEVRAWIDYLDGEIVKRVLVALQPTGGSSGHGSFSSAKVEEGSQEAMVFFLRSPLEETWTHTVVKFLLEHNQENLAELGYAGLSLPRLRLHGKEVRDVDKAVKVFELAAKLRVPVRKSDFYSWFSLQPPNEEDEVLEYPEIPQGMGLGGAGGPLGGAAKPDSGFGLPDLDFGGDPSAAPQEERRAIGEGKSSVAETGAA